MEQGRVPAAQYLRMSTEAQDYSLLNQASAIAAYADQHGFEVIQTYADPAKSGLLLRDRYGLQQLLKDVASGAVAYKVILVLDVSRWGRFQDIDESAHYEYLCKSAGVPVTYCAEPFGTANTLINFIYKALKRSMAGEYSRELSAKVDAAHRRFARMGFKQGGLAGYGLRRLTVSADGTRKQVLQRGEYKGVHSDRITFVPGPPDEVAVVKELFEAIASRRKSIMTLVRELNARNIPNIVGGKWKGQILARLLTDPIYKGTYVYGRTTGFLRAKPKAVPKDFWIVVSGAMEPIISAELFDRAQQALASRTWGRTDEELLDSVRRLLNERGHLDRRLIDHCPYTPAVSTLRRRFGGLGQVYALIGYKSRGDCSALRAHRAENRVLCRELIHELIARFGPRVKLVQGSRPGTARPRIWVDHTLVSVRVARCKRTFTGLLRWSVNRGGSSLQHGYSLDLFARRNPENNGWYDFCLLPAENLRRVRSDSWLKAEDPSWLTGGVKFRELKDFCRYARLTTRRLASAQCSATARAKRRTSSSKEVSRTRLASVPAPQDSSSI